MPLKVPNYGDWEGDKFGGHHPPACTCYDCNEERRRLEASKEEEHRAAEYERRVGRTRTQSRAQGPGQQRSGRAQPPRSNSDRPPPRRPSQRPPQPPSRTGRGRRRPRGPSPRLWLGFLVVVIGLVAAVFFINNPDILAPLQDATVAVLAPTEEPRTNTPVLTPTPKLGPTTASIPTPRPTAEAEELDQAQPRSQPVLSQTIESPSTSPTPGPTPVQSGEAPPDTVLPSPTPSATVLIPPTLVAAPTVPPTTARSPTPVAAPHLRHLTEKQYMLELINQERERAGLPPVELGTNNAAQLHAESSLANCFSGHWGVDGLKPYMRYSLAGGYQSNGENGSGMDYCIKASDGYRAIQSIDREISEMMDGWMGSPGHRRNVLGRWHKKVNIGLAWNRYNTMGYQHFEGDYVEYTALPKIEDGDLSFEGRVKNGAIFGEGRFLAVVVNYDSPPHELARGQLSRTYCYDSGRPVAFLRKPLPSNSYYPEDTSSTERNFCLDPYDVPSDASAPSSATEAHRYWQEAYSRSQSLPVSISVPQITASKWRVGSGGFSVEADLNDVLRVHGAGVYTVLLWGTLSGEAEVVSQYSIFHEVPAPSGYD